MVGKYVDSGDFRLVDSYISVNQSLEHAGAAVGAKVEISWMDSKGFEEEPSRVRVLSEYDGIVVPGAFGGIGAEGMIEAIQYARENQIPFLGLCYGLQVAVVEFARHVCGIEGASSAEIDSECAHKVIEFQPVQRALVKKHAYGGTMRLGAYAAILKEGSQILDLYRRTGRLEEDRIQIEELKQCSERAVQLGVLPERGSVVLERHRHRYEVSPSYVSVLEQGGLVFSGYHQTLEGTRLMEFIELPGHPSFTATQAHPEFKSRLEQPAPLFFGFVEAAAKRQEGHSG
jgi:CTP synthase